MPELNSLKIYMISSIFFENIVTNSAHGPDARNWKAEMAAVAQGAVIENLARCGIGRGAGKKGDNDSRSTSGG